MIARSRRYPAGGSVITRHLTIIYCANFPTRATLLSPFVFVFVFALHLSITKCATFPQEPHHTCCLFIIIDFNMCVICNINFHVCKIVVAEAAFLLE